MLNSHTNVEVLVNGKPIKTFAHQGKIFVQANHQTEYTLRIRNSHWKRRLFVVAVDGINVVDGKAAGSTEMGYIIEGYSSGDINGFRTDLETVHPFKFSTKKKSYAAKSDETGGDTSNCGVIGVQVYDEKEKPVEKIVYRDIHHHHDHYHDRPRRSPHWLGKPDTGTPSDLPWTFTSNTSELTSKCLHENTRSANFLAQSDAGSSVTDWAGSDEPVAMASFSMGTEFGKEAKHDVVREVQFDTGALVTTLSIYYGSRQDLINMGVPVIKETKITAFPAAFPTKFCKPPRS